MAPAGTAFGMWAKRLLEYLEVLERRLAADEYLRGGTITMFSGIPFDKDNPFNYSEAKRTLRLAMYELRKRSDLKRELGMDPKGKPRPAITKGGGTSVWDLLSLIRAKGAKSFTEYPHLTISIQQDRLEVAVVVPNGMRREFRRNLLLGGKEAFFALLEKVQRNLAKSLARVEGGVPWAEIVQRHFPSRRGESVHDAKLQFDLRTAFRGQKGWQEKVRPQPQWLETVYEVLSKKHSNLQLAVGAIFPYSRCPAATTPKVLDHIAAVWLSCKPLIRAAIRRG